MRSMVYQNERVLKRASSHASHDAGRAPSRQPVMNNAHMKALEPRRIHRRKFLQTVSGLAAGAFGALLVRAEDLPRNTRPRAIFGDSAEPAWEERLTITVGHGKADLAGTTDR